MYLEGLPAAEQSVRQRLFDLVEGGPLDRIQLSGALREVLHRHVTTVLASTTSLAMGAIRRPLAAREYSERAIDGYRLFVRMPPATAG
jgi:hypothetical protein